MPIGTRSKSFAGRISGRSRHRPVHTIPQSSIADIAFLLVVFFALLAHEPDRSKVVLPVSEVQSEAEDNAALIVLAYEENEAGEKGLVYKFSDGRQESAPVSGPDAFGEEASQVLGDDPGRQFRIKADGETPCREIGKTLDALTRAGATEVVMITRAPKREGEP